MPRKKKPPIHPLTQQRIDRVLQHHPPSPPLLVPEPSDISLRRWVIDLGEDAMHREVCQRLEERWPLVRDALIAWPNDYLTDKTARFPTLIEFLERITIDSPEIKSGESRFPILEFSSLPVLRHDSHDPRIVRTADAPPDPLETACGDFEERFFGQWLFRSNPYQGRSLGEYERLLAALKELKAQRRRNVLRDLLAKGGEVELAGQKYRVSGRWREKSSRIILRPGDVARILLSGRWGRDPQAIKELLVGLRKESPIASAWARYDHWLQEHPPRREEIVHIICRQPVVLAWPRSWSASICRSPS